jgi:nucleoside triphosphate diphosphatase
MQPDQGEPSPRSVDEALELMRDLRRRCDWDRAQTHQSLRPYLIEEAHEVDDALSDGDDALLRDELGDLLLQLLFHSVIAEERHAFGLSDVAGAMVAKMRARHPHLYGDGIKRPWEQIKQTGTRRAIDEGLPRGLPSLHRAQRLQDRAAGVGFDWPDTDGPMAKVREETDEVADLLATGATTDALEDELGDLLFAVVNLCRKAAVHPALALDRANAKFAQRMVAMQQLADERALDFASLPLAEQDVLWDEVKRRART